jgi:glycerate kinase
LKAGCTAKDVFTTKGGCTADGHGKERAALRVTVAPDSFKESLPAPRAADAIGRGVVAACADIELELVPMADGGEGTVEALVAATGGRRVSACVTDPLGRPVQAGFGLFGDGRGAVIEMAAASGLELLEPAERDPLLTSTRGTGALINAALDAGVHEILIGVGGSATVDCGMGMAAELGVRFADGRGSLIADPCGGRLEDVEAIDAAGLDPRLADVKVTVACDVTNPLTGPQGAAPVYGPQKGADPPTVERLAAGIEHFAAVIRRDLGRDVSGMPGAGAAGGLSAGLVAFLGAEMRSGAQTVIEAVRLRERMAGSDLVITGEGRLDFQSAHGKVPAAVGAVAQEFGIPVVALAGELGPGYEDLYSQGLAAAFGICRGPTSLRDAMDRADELLEDAAESLVRLWLAARGEAAPPSKGKDPAGG